MKTKIPIETVIDIDDETIQWYDIPLFEEYQISNNNLMVRHTDGSKYGSYVETKEDSRYKYRGANHVYINLSDGRKVNAKNAELWDLVVRAHIKPKTTKDAYYSGDYDIGLFPDASPITGLPANFKLIGNIRRKGGTNNGNI